MPQIWRPVRLNFRVNIFQDGSAAFHTIFHVEQARFDPQTLSYTIHFNPVVTSNFRLLIQRARLRHPQSWVAELSQVEVYGANATSNEQIHHRHRIPSSPPP